MLDWGCEYVDDGFYGTQPFSQPKKHPFYIPMELLDKIVDTRYHKEILIKDKRRLENLEANIRENGIQEPGLLTYDRQTIRLQDGNHRYLCAKKIGLEKFPIDLRRVPNIQAPGLSMESVFLDLFRACYSD